MTPLRLAKSALSHLTTDVEHLYVWKDSATFQNTEEAHELANILQLIQRGLLELQQLVKELEK